MRKMKDSGVAWIGEMPEDWTVKRGKFTLKLLNRPVKETDDVITCFRDGEVTLRTNRRTDGFTVSVKEIGYQVGCGFMVGSPGQTVETLYEDLQFIRELQPHMVGIGPFISQKDTPFADKASGTMEQTLKLLAIIRLIHPHVLLPATTALGTIHPKGRELGILSGANVVMPNLSPVNVREKYKLYDNKICTGNEAAECRYCMENRMKSIGYEVAVSRGDYIE